MTTYRNILSRDVLEKDYVQDRLTKAEIARKHGTTVTTVNKYLKETGLWGTVSERGMAEEENLKDREFGRLVVLEYAGLDRFGKRKWLCRCRCGKEKSINAASLIRGLTTSCGCVRRERVHPWSHDISASLWRRKVEEAHKRGIEFSVTPDYVWRVFQEQERKCAMTGLPVTFCRDSNKPGEKSASIDRIDSYRGYVEGNIQIVHKNVNMMKNWLPEIEFVALCNLVAYERKMAYEDCLHHAPVGVCRKTRSRNPRDA